MFEWLTATLIGKIIMTMAVSAVPVVELRGGIPYGVMQGLPIWVAYLASAIGNLLPIPIILLFLDKVFDWMRSYKKLAHIVHKLEAKAHLQGQKVTKYKKIGLMILVAIPLPGTGAWTGALVASVLDIPPREAIGPIVWGVLIAGVLVTIATFGVASLATI
jgi:uncharacterized membrane protein